jgi:hypothetical protein
MKTPLLTIPAAMYGSQPDQALNNHDTSDILIIEKPHDHETVHITFLCSAFAFE